MTRHDWFEIGACVFLAAAIAALAFSLVWFFGRIT